MQHLQRAPIARSSQQTIYYYPMSTQKRIADESPLSKCSDGLLMYNDDYNQYSNKSLPFSFCTASQRQIALTDSLAESLAVVCEPTPFRDGTYLQESTGDSKTIFMPKLRTTPPSDTHIHCNHQPINGQLLQDERLSHSIEDDDDEDDLSSSNTHPKRTKNKNAKYFRHQEDRWFDHFQTLLRYKDMHGNCHVPQNYPEDPALARWARRQRHQYKLNRQNLNPAMSKERQLMLEQVGFIWDPQMDSWEVRRQELEEYKEKYGDCSVPSRYAENPGLATWVKRQRSAYKQFQSGVAVSRVRKERLEILSKMGFVWNRRNVTTSGT